MQKTVKIQEPSVPDDGPVLEFNIDFN